MPDITTLMMAAAGAGGEESDDDFANTVLLLHGDGTNGAQNNTFLDSSTNNFTITRAGNTTQGSFSPFSKPDGRWGTYFSRGRLNATLTGKSAGTGSFTYELWFNSADRAADIANVSALFNSRSSGTGADGIDVKVESNGSIVIGTSAAVLFTSSTGLAGLNTWYHLAIVRNGSTNCEVFLDGTSIGTFSFSNNCTSTDLYIGVAGGAATDWFRGYISNFRYTRAAVYTSAFTPSGPLTAIANAEFLACQSNRFVDNSANAFAITPAALNGSSPKVTPFSPFPITTEYSPAVNGGSGYFDGSGDYLSAGTNAAFAFGTGAFTLEAWIYLTQLPTPFPGQTAAIIIGAHSWEAGGGINWVFRVNASTGYLFFEAAGGANVTSSVAVPINAFNHVAAVRSGTTLTLYLNGVNVGSGTVTANLTSTIPVTIGHASGGGTYGPLTGYVSSARIVNGTAVYTSAFTPPTAPLTAIANTSLLCNFTNAGIFDNTGFNNLETVADAQIDTTVKKYGTGSLEFDGTGDWLLMPHSPDQQLGTGDFTIEFWVYLATGDAGSNRGLVAKGTSTTGFLVSLNTTEKVVFTFTTSTITSTGAITLDAWNHIAVVREGTGSNETKIYIGGTNDGTGTVSTDFNQTSVMYVGANRTGGDPMKGFIDDLRVSRIARYTTTFTPPTKAFPNIGA